MWIFIWRLRHLMVGLECSDGQEYLCAGLEWALVSSIFKHCCVSISRACSCHGTLSLSSNIKSNIAIPFSSICLICIMKVHYRLHSFCHWAISVGLTRLACLIAPQ
uniref:Uncharacterized protein n=1 Tax=Rhipicephalus zambeziensis TaxID=60191 RepID=A0A224YEN4_9ACAR